MFPHKITVFTMNENEEYQKTLIDGVYWYGSNQVTKSGKGVDAGSDITIVIPKKSFKGIRQGSLIVKGTHEDIKSKSELEGVEDCIIVESIAVNDVGSQLDNVVIKGV